MSAVDAETLILILSLLGSAFVSGILVALCCIWRAYMKDRRLFSQPRDRWMLVSPWDDLRLLPSGTPPVIVAESKCPPPHPLVTSPSTILVNPSPVQPRHLLPQTSVQLSADLPPEPSLHEDTPLGHTSTDTPIDRTSIATPHDHPPIATPLNHTFIATPHDHIPITTPTNPTPIANLHDHTSTTMSLDHTPTATPHDHTPISTCNKRIHSTITTDHFSLAMHADHILSTSMGYSPIGMSNDHAPSSATPIEHTPIATSSRRSSPPELSVPLAVVLPPEKKVAPQSSPKPGSTHMDRVKQFMARERRHIARRHSARCAPGVHPTRTRQVARSHSVLASSRRQPGAPLRPYERTFPLTDFLEPEPVVLDGTEPPPPYE